MIEKYLNLLIDNQETYRTDLFYDKFVLIDSFGNKTGKCRRQLAYELRGFEKEIDYSIDIKYLNFNLIKTDYINKLVKAGVLYKPKFEYESQDNGFYGIIDGFILTDNEVTGINIIITSSKSFRFLEENPRDQDLIPCIGFLIANNAEKMYLDYVSIEGDKIVTYEIFLDKNGILYINNNKHKFISKRSFLESLISTKKTMQEKILPNKDYEYRYSESKLTKLHNNGQISTTNFKKAKEGFPIGDWNCRQCKFLGTCYPIMI